MRVVAYSAGSRPRWGFVIERIIVDASLALRATSGYKQSAVALSGLDLRTSLELGLISLAYEAAQKLHVQHSSGSAEVPAGAVLLVSEVNLISPIHNPGKVVGVGLNYRSHANEVRQTVPGYPPLFAKWAHTIIGTGLDIALPSNTDMVDYEGEAALVIGRYTEACSVADAAGAIFGVTVANDVSARDIQPQSSQYTAGKNFRGFLPLGPAIVSTDDLGDFDDLQLRTELNGEIVQAAHLGEMVFSPAELVSYISNVMPLEPGDLILTGTPDGVGAWRDPPRWISSGDEVSVTVGRVGTLTNRFIQA